MLTHHSSAMTDIRFEAEFLRAALLLNLIREAEVIAWADALVSRETDPAALIIELAMTKPELSALRHTLWPLTLPTDLRATGDAVLSFLIDDDAIDRFAPSVVIGMLGQLRTEKMLTDEQGDAVKVFAARLMFARLRFRGARAGRGARGARRILTRSCSIQSCGT
jgi:hypothetical protein